MSDIFILGEAYGEQEEREQACFVGPSGYQLTLMLEEAGIRRADCYLSNVFNLRPHRNDIAEFCGLRTEAIPGYPYLAKGKYVRREFSSELDRLTKEILDVDPNIILALGNTALWALLGTTGISKVRGTIGTSTHTVAGFKVLPTYHPAAILRQWELRPVTILDFQKALRESTFPEVIRPSREIWIEPELEDLERFYAEFIERSKRIAVDIETSGNQITCIGFSPGATISLVVPFVDARRARRSYWPTLRDELLAWAFVSRVLDHPSEKIFQNGTFDISFLVRALAILRAEGAEPRPRYPPSPPFALPRKPKEPSLPWLLLHKRS